MARVSLIDPNEHPELTPIVEKIRSGRRGTVINVYKLLLHSPAIAEIWLELINAARWKTDLDGRLREIAIIRIGYLNRCSYVIKQHVPLLSAAEGLGQEECNALADWRASPFFSERERAALAFADASTRDKSDAAQRAIRRGLVAWTGRRCLAGRRCWPGPDRPSQRRRA